MPINQDEIKEKLLKLAEDSPALKTLSEEERTERMDAMTGATTEQMLKLIKIFEDENLRIKQIEEDPDGSEIQINQFIAETKIEKKNNDRKERIEKEFILKADDDKYAEDLIKKLNEIV
jgi:hypothetical protein